MPTEAESQFNEEMLNIYRRAKAETGYNFRLSSIRCGSGVRVVGRFRERWGSYGTAGVSTRYARSALRCDPGG